MRNAAFRPVGSAGPVNIASGSGRPKTSFCPRQRTDHGHFGKMIPTFFRKRDLVFLLICFFALQTFAQTRYVDAAVGADVGDCTGAPCLTISYAVSHANAGDDILIEDGLYNENVNVDKNDLFFHSVNGAAAVTVQGSFGNPELGTFYISNVTGTTIGAPDEGLTILGYDSPLPAIEHAAIYCRSNYSNTTIQGNVITANGEAGFLSEFGAPASNIILDGNTFNGQTFVGPEPGDCGFANQFTAANVPRQLVYLTPLLFNVEFTNNRVVGTTGGFNTALMCDQGNNLVTIDSDTALVSGNLFAGTTTRFATSLRMRGQAASILCNEFQNFGLSGLSQHIYLAANYGQPLTGGASTSLALIAGENYYTADGAYIDPQPVSYPHYIFKTLAEAQAVAVLPRVGVQANVNGPTASCCPDIIDFRRNELDICSGETIDFSIFNIGSVDVTFDLIFIDSMEAGIFPKDLDPENMLPYVYSSLTIPAGDSLRTTDLMPAPIVRNVQNNFDRGRILMGIQNIAAAGAGAACSYPDMGPGTRLGMGTRVWSEPRIEVMPVRDTICSGDQTRFDADLLFPSMNPSVAGFPIRLDWVSFGVPEITGNTSSSIIIYDAMGMETQMADITDVLVNSSSSLFGVAYSMTATSAGPDQVLNTADDCQSIPVRSLVFVAPFPDLICPADTTVDCDSPTDTATLGMPVLMAAGMDMICMPNAPTFSDVITPGGCPGEYTITRTFNVMDMLGNMNTCVQTISVQDTTPPTFLGPRNATVACAGDIFDFGTVGQPLFVSDNCGVMDTSYVDDFTEAETCFSLGYILRTWTVTDSCGNSAQHTQTLFLEDVDCLPCPDTLIMAPGDTCLIPPVNELPWIQRVEVIQPGVNAYINLGLPLGCFEVGFFDSRFSGYDSICVIACDTFFGREYCDTTKIIVISCDPVACKSYVNLSLDETCSAGLVPGMIIQPQRFPTWFYTFEVTDKFGNPHPPYFDLSDINQRFNVTVGLPACRNACWAEILVEDKFAPEVICQDDTMSCIEFMHLIDEPDVIEHCQDYTLEKVDEQITVMDCDTAFQKLVTQKWIAIDESGNVSDTCTQSVWISRFPLDSVEGPRRGLRLYCGSGYRRDANGHPHPDVTGVPTLYGYDLWPITDFFCNVGVTYKDDYLGKVGCEERIMRTWTVREWWCLEDDERYFNQFFTIIDDVGPEVVLSNDTVYAKAGVRSCSAWVEMPEAEVSDVCHDVERVDMVYPGGFSGDQNGGHIELPVGLNEVIYRVFDECYNETTDTVYVLVKDQVAPIAVCEQNTVVSLDNDGEVHVYAEAFDDGSFDECELKGMEVRRMSDNCNSGTDTWGDYVAFCCADIGQDIMVAFRVTDKSGNMGTCMVRVQVQDKLPPVYADLPDITVDCRFDIDRSDMSVFGTYVYADSLREAIVIDAEYVNFSGPALDGYVEDNCPPVMKDSVDFGGVDNCGLGRIYRHFWFYDLQGNETHTDVQVIDIINNRPFDSTQIIWPVDVDTVNVCGSENLRPERLSLHQAFPRFIDEDECSLVAYDYHDELIDASIGSEACYKIVRKWTVIDWCQRTRRNVHKKWHYEQYLVVENTIAPEITSSCTDTVRCVYNVRCEPEEMVLHAIATDDCTNASDLYWTYKIDTLNDGTFDIIGHSDDATGVYPIGVHRIKWLVEDLCGNQDSCEYLFELRNCKAPTAYCKNGVIAELSGIDVDGDGTLDNEVAEIWASDFDENSGHPCGHEVVLSFSSDTSDKLRVYDCDSLVPPIRDVTIWVTDKVTGEVSRCRTFVNVQDNNTDDVCGNTLNSGVVSGLLYTETQERIRDVEVNLTNSGQGERMTDREGYYEFAPMPFGGIYEVVPVRDGDDDNGVSTADLVKIQRHLLGKEMLNSPYRLIAADVNNSSTVTAADISELRKFILGVYGELPNNTSWRFVDEGYDFPDPQDPWYESFPESYRIEPFVQDMDVDFVGVKVGDVTGDVDVSGAVRNAPRSVRKLRIEDGEIAAGRSYEVMLTLTDLASLSGYQFTLEWNTSYLELEEVVPNLGIGMGLQNFGMNDLESGVLTTSWHRGEREVKSGEERLFLLKFKGKGNGQLSELMTVSDKVTRRECYAEGYDGVEGLELEIVGGEANRYFALYQNEPNPWSTETYVSFHLPEHQRARLTVYDENGREVYVVEGEYERGYNEVQIGKSEIPGSGLLYYRLETRDHVATRKMIIIE